MRENYTLKRLYIEEPLSNGHKVNLRKDQCHYLSNVLRMRVGDELRLFNGQDGEWLGVIESLSKKQTIVQITKALRQSGQKQNVTLAFAPIRRHRTAFIIEKGTELGVTYFQPVLTDHTQFPKLNFEKARLQMIEAAEQTERLDIPELKMPQPLPLWLEASTSQSILFADEAGEAGSAHHIIKKADAPVSVLVGPEGGFSETERQLLRGYENVSPLSLGPRILRADTAALSLLTLWQALKGDWV